MLIFRVATPAQRRLEAYADPILWFLHGVLKAGVIERQLGRGDRELCVAIKSLQAVRWEILLRIPIADFSSALGIERARLKSRDAADAALLSENSIPELV